MTDDRDSQSEEWARLGSNQRPPWCEHGALSLSYWPEVANDIRGRIEGLSGALEASSDSYGGGLNGPVGQDLETILGTIAL